LLIANQQYFKYYIQDHVVSTKIMMFQSKLLV
jgi:hypothetical protein